MIQTCLSILTRALAGVGVYKIQEYKGELPHTQGYGASIQ